MMGEASVKGLQNYLLDKNFHIIASAKHYAGDGGTGDTLWQNMWGIDRGNTAVSEKILREIHLKPYLNAIKAGVKCVMVSFSSWNGKKMHENRYLITDVLKGELQFKGFVSSDWGAIQLLPGDYPHQVAAAINAGIDMVMVPGSYQWFTYVLKQLVGNWYVPMSRIDDAVRRILRVKFEMGLFEHPFADRSFLGRTGIKEHRETARRCVRESLVLLKNKNSLLPLPKKIKKLFVCGKSSDNLGFQCGGWTLNWMGFDGNKSTTGTTILQALQKSVSPQTEVIYSMDGRGLDDSGADAAIVVLGETPYAEFMGDRYDLSLSEGDYDLINLIKTSRIPKILILISGRPLIITDVVNDFDAILAAWLPGTEGEGITDILFGDFKPAGKLSFTWPKNMAQVPINTGDKNYDPLYPFGYGLTY